MAEDKSSELFEEGDPGGGFTNDPGSKISDANCDWDTEMLPSQFQPDGKIQNPLFVQSFKEKLIGNQADC